MVSSFLISNILTFCAMSRRIVVDNADILSEAQVREEEWTAMELVESLIDNDNCLEWCAK